MPDCVDERAPECSKNKMSVRRLSVPKKKVIISDAVGSVKINKGTDETVGSVKIYIPGHICHIPRCHFALV